MPPDRISLLAPDPRGVLIALPTFKLSTYVTFAVFAQECALPPSYRGRPYEGLRVFWQHTKILLPLLSLWRGNTLYPFTSYSSEGTRQGSVMAGLTIFTVIATSSSVVQGGDVWNQHWKFIPLAGRFKVFVYSVLHCFCHSAHTRNRFDGSLNTPTCPAATTTKQL